MLFGIDTNFPLDVNSYITRKNLDDIKSEEIKIGILKSDISIEYDVIFDRISEFVPFYKSFLRKARAGGTKVISNCFSNCQDDDFIHLSNAAALGIKVPKTALIPGKWLPKQTTPESMRNLIYPLNWDEMFDYVGFPANLKSNFRNDSLYDYKVYNKSEFFSAYELTGSNTMILQEIIAYDKYLRCFVVGKKNVLIAKYDPLKPLHLRYSPEEPDLSEDINSRLIDLSRRISNNLDYHFNAIDFGIKSHDIYAVEFKSAMPKIERHILHDINYDKLVSMLGDYLIELCRID